MADQADASLLPVDPCSLRCVCLDVELASLRAYPDARTAQDETGAGTACEMCLPYIEALFTQKP